MNSGQPQAAIRLQAAVRLRACVITAAGGACRLRFEDGNTDPPSNPYVQDTSGYLGKLLSRCILPEELFHILFNGRFRLRNRPIRVHVIHKGAFAIFSAKHVSSDIYIFDTECTRLLRRIHVPRATDTLGVLSKGFYFAVVADTKLSIYAPRTSKEIRLRAWNPA